MSELPAGPQQSNIDIAGAIDQVDQHPAAVCLAGLSPGSRRTMRGALDTMAQIITGNDQATLFEIPWQRLRFQHTQALRSVLTERYAYSTANRMLSALRGTLKAAWKLGLMPAEDYQKAASVESVSGETVPAGRALSAGELAALINTCNQKPLGIRDAAIISLLYGCGLRRAELVALNSGHYNKEENELIVRGKGNKQRAVPVGNAARALSDWLAVRGEEIGPFFWGLGNRNRRGKRAQHKAAALLHVPYARRTPLDPEGRQLQSFMD